MSRHTQDGPHSAWRVAARYGDADAEETDLFETLRRQGINTEEYQHIADQRALRVVLQQRPGFTPAILSTTTPEMVALDPLERAAHIVFQACYYDGLYIGWRARGLAEATLSPEDAAFAADMLKTLAEIDAGENTDYERLVGLAHKLEGTEE
jgi:hypothetical protein